MCSYCVSPSPPVAFQLGKQNSRRLGSSVDINYPPSRACFFALIDARKDISGTVATFPTAGHLRERGSVKSRDFAHVAHRLESRGCIGSPWPTSADFSSSRCVCPLDVEESSHQALYVRRVPSLPFFFRIFFRSRQTIVSIDL